MKKKYFLASIALVVIVMLVNTSLAYFTSNDSEENVFTVGDIKISLTEEKWDDSLEHVILPNKSYDKDPVVKNIGNNPAYVRINLKIVNYEAVENAVSSTGFVITDIFDIDNSKWISANEPVVEGNSITYSYYYHKILEVNESSDPLFTKVSFPNDLDVNVIYQMDGYFEIIVKADAIQSDNFNNVEDAFAAFDNEVGGN